MTKIIDYGFQIILSVLLACAVGVFYQFVFVKWGKINKESGSLEKKVGALKGLISGKVYNQGEIDELLRHKQYLRQEASKLIIQLEQYRRGLLIEPDPEHTNNRNIYKSDGQIDAQILRDAYRVAVTDKWQIKLKNPEDPETPPEGLPADKDGEDYFILKTQPEQDELVRILKNFNIREKIINDLVASKIEQLEVISVGDKPTGSKVRPTRRGGLETLIDPFSKIPFSFTVRCQVADIKPFLARLMNQSTDTPPGVENSQMLIQIDDMHIKKVDKFNNQITIEMLQEEHDKDPSVRDNKVRAEVNKVRDKTPCVRLILAGYVVDFNREYLYPKWQGDGEFFKDPHSGEPVTAGEKKKIQQQDRQLR
ncbi:hypothetical protein ACFL54_02655 [Planctomycetota bacterium]